MVSSQISIVLLHPSDSVCIAARPLAEGTELEVGGTRFKLRQPIRLGHKIAIRSVKKGDRVLRYGQTIGLATAAIEPGEWVHSHNLAVGEFDRDFAAAENRIQRPVGRTPLGEPCRHELQNLGGQGCPPRCAPVVYAIAFSPDKSVVYLGGHFGKVNTVLRNEAAAVSLSGLAHQLEYRLTLPEWASHSLNKTSGTARDKAKGLRELVAAGDPLAQQLFDDQARALGITMLSANYLGDYDRLVRIILDQQ